MRLPRLPKPGPKRAERSPAAQLRTQRWLEDLYRDMRDRRLLLPALLLIVATLAIPVALSADRSDPPAPLAFTPPEGSEAVAPAVLAEQVTGVRDYRKRLKELKSKNPFAFPTPEKRSGTGATTGSEAPMGGDASAGGNLPGPLNNDTGAPTGPGTQPDDASSPQGTSPAGEPAPAPAHDPEVLVVAPRINVVAGKAGERRKIKGVEPGHLLPDRRKAPIAMFLGATDKLRFAHFLISEAVTSTEGDGGCRPGPNNCQFLRLSVGDRRFFTFGPDDERHSIKVTAIREQVIDRR